MNNPPKILIVDDDPVQLQVIGHAIQTASTYVVMTATSAPRALRLAEETVPDLIISDYYMPEMDGFGLCRAIKAHPTLRDAMVIMLTSASSVDKLVEGLDTGADDYITKPFHSDELLSRVKVSLRLKALRDQMKKEHEELTTAKRELEGSFNGVIEMLAHLVGHRVPNASIRGDRAAKLVSWVGQKMGMIEHDRTMVQVAARLHEIGKISFSDDLLRKQQSEFSPEERQAASHFPVMGQLLLNRIPRLLPVATFLRHQMENYDGSGYPDKLVKEQTPLGSRILRAVNVLEQATMEGGVPADMLIVQLTKLKGTVLDPRVVQCVTEYLEVIDKASWLVGKQQVSVYGLKVGMVIAHDLTTGSGTTLLSSGSKITLSIMDRILSHHRHDPIVNNVYVFDRAV